MLDETDQSRRAEALRLWHLAWPVSLGMLAYMGMGVVDTLMVAPLGERPMAAVSLANTWFYSMAVLGFGMTRALDPVISQAHGARDRVATGRAFVDGAVMCVLVIPLLILLVASGRWGLEALQQPAELLDLAGRYCVILACGVPGMVAFGTLKQMLQGIGSVRPAAFALLVANVLNAVLVYVLVYVVGLGAIGCAIATALCNWFNFLFLLWISRDLVRGLLPARPEISWARVAGLVAIGLPLGVQMGMENWAFSAAGIMMGWLGPTQLAAHAIVMNLATLSFMLPLGISAAASTRVGNLIGSEQPWTRAATTALLMGAGVMSISGLCYSLIPGWIVGLYRPEASVFVLAVALLPLAGAFQLFDGIQVVAFGVLRGAGDLKIPSLANLLGYWAVGLPLGAWLAFYGGFGAQGVWVGLGTGLATVAVLLLFRVRATTARGGRRVAVS